MTNMQPNPITTAFDRARAARRRALVPFLMSGFPTRDGFRAALAEAATLADVIEVGVPFSDPLADGPVIQAAAAQALKQGTTLAQTLQDVAGVKGPPVVFMLSINQVLAGGAQQFARRLKMAGVAGAIVPDLPFEESGPVQAELAAHGLTLLNMLAPTTAPDRVKGIAQAAQGFLYLISSTGVTGTRDAFPPETLAYIKRAKELSRAPVCVGFGISRPEHVKQLADADGFIVGSALIKAQSEGRSIKEVLQPLQAAL